MNSSRSWSKEGSAEKQGYLSGKDKRKFNRIVNIYKILVIWYQEKIIEWNNWKKKKNSDLDETRGKLCMREPVRVPGLQNIVKAYMCWDYVSNLALLPVIRHNQCWGQLQDAEVLLRWDTEGRHYHAESIPRRRQWGVGVSCCKSFLAGHCCAAVPPKSLFTSVLIVEGRE